MLHGLLLNKTLPLKDVLNNLLLISPPSSGETPSDKAFSRAMA